jgi:hypothetical protein
VEGDDMGMGCVGDADDLGEVIAWTVRISVFSR